MKFVLTKGWRNARYAKEPKPEYVLSGVYIPHMLTTCPAQAQMVDLSHLISQR